MLLLEKILYMTLSVSFFRTFAKIYMTKEIRLITVKAEIGGLENESALLIPLDFNYHHILTN